MVNSKHAYDMGKSAVRNHKQAIEDGLMAMARALEGETFLFVVIGDGHIATSVSSDLKAYERGFVAEVEKAKANHIEIFQPGSFSSLRRAEEALGRTKHTELHPIVAVLIEGLNKMNGVRVSRSTALKDISAIPSWWPHNPKKYAERMQQLTIKDLTVVIDSIIKEVRRDRPRVEKLWAMLTAHFKTGSCSIGTRAVFDAYFEFLLKEAVESGNGSHYERTSGNGSGDSSADEVSSPSNAKDAFPLDLNLDVDPGQLPVSNVTGNALGNGLSSAMSGFLSVAPSNLHRPQPIRPQFTKQDLRLQSTADDSPCGVRSGGYDRAVAQPRVIVGSQQAADTAEILGRSLFTPQQYVESDRVGKRPRVEEDSVDLAWTQGSDGVAMMDTATVSNLVHPPTHNAKPISALLQIYDAPEDASPSDWRKLFEQAGALIGPGIQQTVHNGPFARSTDHNGPASFQKAAKPEPREFGRETFPVSEKAESPADAAVEVLTDTVTENLQRLAGNGRASGRDWMAGGAGNRGRDPRFWCPENVRGHVEGMADETEDAVARQRQAAPADVRIPKASDALGALVRSPSPSELLISANVPSKQRDDLGFVVGTLVRGYYRISASEGVRAPNVVPDWFPFPQHFANFAETLGKEDLLALLTIVFQKVRGEYFHIRELRTQWNASRGDVSNSAMRATIETYFDALEREAAAPLILKNEVWRPFQSGPKDEPMGGVDLQL